MQGSKCIHNQSSICLTDKDSVCSHHVAVLTLRLTLHMNRLVCTKTAEDCLPIQIRTCHPLAICYNDQSPLENHHLAAAVRTVLQTEHRFMSVSPQLISSNLMSAMLHTMSH